MDEVSENALQSALVEAALLNGWKVYWVPDWVYRVIYRAAKARGRRSGVLPPPGFPDLVLVKGRRLEFWECKSKAGRVRPGQEEWADALNEVVEVRYRLVRPKDQDEMMRFLSGER